MSSRIIPHYFVCSCCGAKWFQQKAVANCPRCHTRCVSDEQIIPPWQLSRQRDAAIRKQRC
jgi:hypothetical protein